MCVCVCVCVCVCASLAGKGSERIWNKCEKGKGKEGERLLSALVMNSYSALCKGRRDYCVGLCKGHPPWHISTEFVWYMTKIFAKEFYI